MQIIRFILKHKTLSLVCLAASLTGCASTPPPSSQHASTSALRPDMLARQPDILLLGEQHDAPSHQQWQRDTVAQWAADGKLAAVVMEMADAGYSTQAVDKLVDESAVKQALNWNDKGWPWANYGPVVMAAVRAGVPVYGGNLPRAGMRDAMQQPSWDSHLSADAWQRQREAIREGHCGLMSASQITPMARIQLAKDASMARTAQQHLQPGKTVLLIAGRGHVLRSLGVPTWLPERTSALVAIGQAADTPQAAITDRDWVHNTPAVPAKDHCADLRAKWKK